jgi:tRNA(Ile)-lysidine synthase
MTARAALPFSPDVLGKALDRLGATERLCVALSGGADSAALLVAAAVLAAQGRCALRALHIDHGFAGSPLLRQAAIAAAACCGVALQVVTVEVCGIGDLGLEAAARDARWRGFAESLAAGEDLLTAHHLEDQAETVLLQLLRGAGARGLAAMSTTTTLGVGRLLRPLLGVPRAALRDYASAQAVPWLEDPSNADLGLDRNYLRSQVWPELTARWPAAARTLARSASHLGGTVRLLEAELATRLAAVEQGGTLDLAALARLDAGWRLELIRYWLRGLGFSVPPTRRLAQFDVQFLYSAPDSQPRLAWGEIELQRYDGRLHARQVLPSLALPAALVLPTAGSVELGVLGRIVVALTTEGGLRVAQVATYRLTTRRGGERWRRDLGGPERALKDWFREARVPRWQRERAVLIWSGLGLAAVVLPSATWIGADYRAESGEVSLGVHWQGAPAALAMTHLH